MSYTTQNNSVMPPSGDKPPIQSHYSPDFDQKIFKALFPYHRNEKRMDSVLSNGLTDTHALLLDSVMGQVELLLDLGNKISGNEDIAGFGLVGFADGLNRQLRLLDVIQSEFHNQVSHLTDELKGALSESERIVHDQSVKIAELERTVAVLKGGVV